MSISNPILLEDLISNDTKQVHGRKRKWLKTQLNKLFKYGKFAKITGFSC